MFSDMSPHASLRASAGWLPGRQIELKPLPPEVRATLRPHWLAGERVVLRPLEASDAPAFADLVRRSRDAVGCWVPLGRPGEGLDEFVERQVEASRRGEADRRSVRRVIAVPDGGVPGGGRLAGLVAINGIERGLEWKGDLVVWVEPALQGIGLGREAAQTLCDWALADVPFGLGLGAVYAGIDPENEACARALGAAGFRRTGERSHLEVGEGRWRLHDFWVRRAA